MTQSFTLTVNQETVRVTADPDTSLLSVLRDDLDLKGAKFGCGQGLCGACFVQVDGKVVASCDTPMWSAAGTSVVTVEGLADGDLLHAVQQAVLDEQAAQCGFCLSGVMVHAAALLAASPRPDETTVAEALDRNLCRCGVQRRIVRAVVEAGKVAG